MLPLRVPRCAQGDFDEGCARDGVLGALAGVMGSLQAVEVLKELLGIGRSLSGSLTIYDGLGGRFHRMAVRRDPECPLVRGRSYDPRSVDAPTASAASSARRGNMTHSCRLLCARTGSSAA